jgi:demethylmenaquinone methyltransferase/2-methoxy-6-polyprenyl-1,4-benzoquinol methylase
VAVGALPGPAEKAAVVRAMFDRIAPHYDRLNAVMTWRLDRRWRRAAIAAATLGPNDLAIDVACGTGDLAALATRAGTRVVGIDFAAAMLAGASSRATGAQLVRADATALPVASASADAVTCGFALRNFVAIPPMLAEAARVLRPGGRLVLLEVATPRHALVRWGHRLYFERVVPRLGAWLADEAAYAYLPQSVAYLPDPPALRAMVVRAGFRDVTRRLLGFGAVQLLRAQRAETA